MTLKHHIETSVNNEFNTVYERNLVKTYLFYWLLKKPETNRQYYNYEIAFLVGITPKMVSDYLWRMEKEDNRRKDPFLLEGFEDKFDNVEKACVGYAEILRLQELSEAQDRAYNSVKTTREINIEYYLN